MQQTVEQRRGVAARQDEAIAVRPERIGRVVAEVSGPQQIGHRRLAERRAGVAGFRLLDHVDGEKAQSIDGELVDVGALRGGVLDMRGEVYSIAAGLRGRVTPALGGSGAGVGGGVTPALRDLGPASSEAGHRPQVPERRCAPAKRGKRLFSLPYRRGVAGPRAPMGAERAFSARAPMGSGPDRTPSGSWGSYLLSGKFFDSTCREPIRSAGLVRRAERWPSGLRQRFAKPSYGVNLYRGFESLPLRQFSEFRPARSDERRAGSMH